MFLLGKPKNKVCVWRGGSWLGVSVQKLMPCQVKKCKTNCFYIYGNVISSLPFRIISMSVNVSFIVTQLPHIQFKMALETSSRPRYKRMRRDISQLSPVWRKVELFLSLVENQEQPVHDVEDYKHSREGFQKELVNPKRIHFSVILKGLCQKVMFTRIFQKNGEFNEALDLFQQILLYFFSHLLQRHKMFVHNNNLRMRDILVENLTNLIKSVNIFQTELLLLFIRCS